MKNVVGEGSGDVGHAPSVARGAGAASLAGGGEPDDPGPSGLVVSRACRLPQATELTVCRAKDAGGISIARY